MKKMFFAAPWLLLPLMLPAAAAVPAGTLSAVAPGTLSAANAAADIDGERMLRHIRVLASDRYEGRALGGNGERLTLDYLQRQLIRFGVGPGKADGGYLQSVPLLAVASRPSLSFSTGARSSELVFPLDYLAWSQRAASQVVLQGSDMLFVGYGVTAPAYHWDDYQGVDVRGKTLLMLGGAPALFGVATPGAYGSASYKFALAQKLGAAGALIVQANGTAGTPSYESLRKNVVREQFSLRDDADAADLPALSGWLRPERAQDIARSVGYDFENLKKSALSRDFKPVVLGVTASATVENRWRNLVSYNVVAKIDGTDPVLKNEVVVYSANWDQYGIDVAESGAVASGAAASGTGAAPQLYRGARNNASGVAALLEVARAYRALRRAPKRSVLFVLTTGGGERGALGARHYAAHPLYPLDKTILNINIDGLNLWGRTRDVVLVGAGNANAARVAARIAQRQGRVLRPNGRAPGGVLYRGDQSAFAAANVPVLMLGAGREFVNKRSTANRDKFERNADAGYHQSGDVVHPGWDMSGAAEDAELLFKVGYEVAQGK